MLLDIHKQHRAEDDLLGIWLYSAEQWGKAQADRYLDAIDADLERLREAPMSGQDFGHLRRGYRRLKVERHHAYYTISRTRIDIIRVLHPKMDVTRLLG